MHGGKNQGRAGFTAGIPDREDKRRNKSGIESYKLGFFTAMQHIDANAYQEIKAQHEEQMGQALQTMDALMQALDEKIAALQAMGMAPGPAAAQDSLPYPGPPPQAPMEAAPSFPPV